MPRIASSNFTARSRLTASPACKDPKYVRASRCQNNLKIFCPSQLGGRSNRHLKTQILQPRSSIITLIRWKVPFRIPWCRPRATCRRVVGEKQLCPFLFHTCKHAMTTFFLYQHAVWSAESRRCWKEGSCLLVNQDQLNRNSD
jgi:hypothetical protein